MPIPASTNLRPTRYGLLLDRARSFLRDVGFTEAEIASKEVDEGIVRMLAHFADDSIAWSRRRKFATPKGAA